MKKHRRVSATKGERERMQRVSECGCLCCHLNRGSSLEEIAARLPLTNFKVQNHHLIDGNKRRGHKYTIGLCDWHHQGIRPRSMYHTPHVDGVLGPSLAHGSRPFHERYGSDDELWAMQEALLKLVYG